MIRRTPLPGVLRRGLAGSVLAHLLTLVLPAPSFVGRLARSFA